MPPLRQLEPESENEALVGSILDTRQCLSVSKGDGSSPSSPMAAFGTHQMLTMGGGWEMLRGKKSVCKTKKGGGGRCSLLLTPGASAHPDHLSNAKWQHSRATNQHLCKFCFQHHAHCKSIFQHYAHCKSIFLHFKEEHGANKPITIYSIALP